MVRRSELDGHVGRAARRRLAASLMALLLAGHLAACEPICDAAEASPDPNRPASLSSRDCTPEASPPGSPEADVTADATQRGPGDAPSPAPTVPPTAQSDAAPATSTQTG